MENTFIFAQIFGFCAMSLSVYAWQVKNPRMILLLYVPVGLLWASQYYLLGTVAGVAIAIIGANKDLIMAFVPRAKAKYVICTFFIIAWGFGLQYVESAIDLAPLLATTLFNLALLQPDNRYLMARINVLSQFLWVVFNLSVGAYMGVACSVLLVSSAIIGMARVESWELGKCYRTFGPSFIRALFVFPSFRTYP